MTKIETIEHCYKHAIQIKVKYMAAVFIGNVTYHHDTGFQIRGIIENDFSLGLEPRGYRFDYSWNITVEALYGPETVNTELYSLVTL